MNCKKAQSLILDHLYGNLKPRKQAALLEHLGGCSHCSEEFEAHRITTAAFSRMDMEEPPAALSERIVAMAARDMKESEQTGRNALGLYWKPALATVAAASLAVIMVIRHTPQSAITPRMRVAQAPESEMANERTEPSKTPLRRSKSESKLGAGSVSGPEAISEALMMESKLDYLDADETAASKTNKNMFAVGQDKGVGDMVMDDAAAYRGRRELDPNVSGHAASLSDGFSTGLVGGKAGEDQPRDAARHIEKSSRILSPAAPEPEPPSVVAVGGFGEVDSPDHAGNYPASPATDSREDLSQNIRAGRLDSKDSIGLIVAEEEKPAPAAKTRLAAPKPAATYAPAEQPLSMPKAKPKFKKQALKEEVSRIAGGTSAVGELKSDLVLGEMEQEKARSNEAFEQPELDQREFDRGEFGRALESVMDSEKAAAREGDRQLGAEYKHKLGETYREENECDKALLVYQAIIDEHPDYEGLADVHIAMADCSIELKQFDDAILSFEIVRDNFPEKREMAEAKIAEIAEMKQALEKADE